MEICESEKNARIRNQVYLKQFERIQANITVSLEKLQELKVVFCTVFLFMFLFSCLFLLRLGLARISFRSVTVTNVRLFIQKINCQFFPGIYYHMATF